MTRRLLPLLAIAGLCPAPSAVAEVVWHEQPCATPRRLELRVDLDGKPLHRSVRTLCRVEREAAVHPPRQNIIAFDASPMRGRLGLDRRTPLEGNLWEAGMERSGIVLGVSLQDGKRVHLKTLLWIGVTKRERNVVGDGLVVTTTPLP